VNRSRFREGKAGSVVAVAALLGTLAGPLGAQQPVEQVITLEDAVALALESNRELEAARLELAKAGGQVREAWGNVFPRVNVVTNYTRNVDVPVNFLPARFLDPSAPEGDLVALRFGTDNVWYNQLRFEQPLFQASAFLGVGAAARYEALQVEAYRGTRQHVATRVRIAYFDVLLAEEALRLTETSLSRVRQAFEETQALYRAGMVSEYDALRLEVEMRNLEPRVRQARSRSLAARRALAVELGLRDGESLRVNGSLAALTFGDATGEVVEGNASLLAFASRAIDAGDADELVARALRERSDLRQLALMRELRDTELKVERSEYLPRVALWGTQTLTAQQNGAPEWFGGQNASNRQIGIQVTMPIFSGLQRPARIQQIRATVQQVATQLRLAEVQAENHVRTLVDAVEEARERLEAQRLAIRQATRGWEIARAQNREGIGSQLQVNDAEGALRETEFNYAQAVYDYLVARARLDEATGAVD
jgi:outer membrane protein